MPVVRKVPSAFCDRKTSTSSPTRYSGLPKIHSLRSRTRPPGSRRTTGPLGSEPKRISSGSMCTYVLTPPEEGSAAASMSITQPVTAAIERAARSRSLIRMKVLA